MTREEFRRRSQELIESLVDGLPSAEVRRIEREHEELETAWRSQVEAESAAVYTRAFCQQNGLDWSRYENLEVDERRTRVWEDLVARSNESTPIFGQTGTDYHRHTPQTRAAAMAEALVHRLNPGRAPSDGAREFVGLSIPDMARRSLEFSGQRTVAMSGGQIVTRALHSTSDFPYMLGDAVGRVLRLAYSAAPSGLKMAARQTTAADFRAKHSIQFSEAPRLEKVNEAGEFKRGTFAESKESYRLASYGKIFGITRQALVNDDLGAFDSIPRRLGQAASAFEAQFLCDLLVSNPVMSDNVALFAAAHGNLDTGGNAAAIGLNGLSAARTRMRKQVGLTGELISVTPKFLIVPTEQETLAEQFVATLSAATSDEVNPFSGKLTVMVEPRLVDDGAWYIAADPAEIDGLEFAYLEGDEGPQIDTKAGFDVDGVEIKVRLDFGAGFVDHRGWYRNDGA
ncbi:MAG: peptidase U35 [Mesorhizobium sp.]|nr:MAG: peptidase U35 [Mesorhizobium sp.]